MAQTQIAQYLGTGKRKTSVARVILRPGDGATWFNGRTIEEYFPRAVHRQLALAPLKVAELEGRYDIRVRVHGGGPSGQAGAVRHGIARALVDLDPGAARAAQARGLPDARRAHRRAQEGRPAQGAQSAAVLQALKAALSALALGARHALRPRRARSSRPYRPWLSADRCQTPLWRCDFLSTGSDPHRS